VYNLLNIYDCPNCGKRLSDEVEYITVQVADDEWCKMPFCNKCNSGVKIRMYVDPETKQEIYSYEEVDDERARWAHGFYDENNNDDDDDWDGDDFYDKEDFVTDARRNPIDPNDNLPF
jgi:transcription elongation factor Elf1